VLGERHHLEHVRLTLEGGGGHGIADVKRRAAL